MRFFPLLVGLGLISAASAQAATMEKYDLVKLQSLNKATARTMTFEAPVGKTVKFGPLYIRPQSCEKPPATERPESAAFLQVWQAPIDKAAETGADEGNKSDSEWIFSGWMFASSPGLSSMDHPVYDVWVLDCLSTTKTSAADESAATDPAEESEPVVRLNEEAPQTDFQDYETEAEPTVHLD